MNDTCLLDDIAQVVYTEEQLQTRISELGAQISADYVDKNPVLVGVLRAVASGCHTCSAGPGGKRVSVGGVLPVVGCREAR